MKKKSIFPLFGAVLFSAAFLFFLTQDTAEQATTPSKNKISGSFDALQSLADAQTYPFESVPAKAQYAAWEQMQTMPVPTTERGSADEWEALGPYNRGGRTLSLAFNPLNPDVIYAGSASGGLWRTRTAGVGPTAWHQVDIPFPVLSVTSVTFVPNDSMTMYLGTGEVYNVAATGTGAAYRATRGSSGFGILKTSDGGQTWEKSLDWSYNQEHGVWAVKAAPTNTDIVYAATTDGIYKSTNAGGDWTRILDVKMGNDLVIHPNDENLIVVGCGNLGSAGKGIYRSTDGGTTWDIISSNVPLDYQGKIQLNYAESNPNVVYASFGNGFSSATGATTLCRSADFGATWQIQNETDYSIWQGWFAHDVAVNPWDENKIACIGIEVWRSDNAGVDLELVSVGGIGPQNAPSGGQSAEPNFVHSDAHDVIWHPTDENTFYIASDGGINRSRDNGQTFELLTGGYQTAQFYNGIATTAADSNFLMGGLQDNGTNKWNQSDDKTWFNEFGGDGSWCAVSPFSSSTYYFSYQNLNAYIFNGTFWDYMDIPKLSPVSFIAPFIISHFDGLTMYAGSAGVAKSIDGGLSWTLMNGGNRLGQGPALAMEMAAQNPEVLYVGTAPTYPFNGTSRAELYVSTNGGVSFFNRTNGLPDRFIMDVAVDPIDERTAYVTMAGYGEGHVYRTTNYGLTWENITNNLPDAPTNAVIVDPEAPNHIYVGNDLGVFASVDGGENWFPFMENLPAAVMVFDLKISPSSRKLRIGSHGNGAYQRKLLPIGFVETQSPISKANDVHVFPNPVDVNLTKINFDKAISGDLQVQLFDAQGRILGQKQLNLIGAKSIDWPFDKSTTGLHYIQCRNEAQVWVKAVYL